MPDKFKATWVSHSSIGDFLECPRLYYLRNVYKDPKTGHKINIVSPHMSLGIAVHNVLEGLAEVKSEERVDIDLDKRFEEEWSKVTGKKGGFGVIRGVFPMSALGKAKGSGHEEGFVEMVADESTHEILGCQIVGDHASDLIAEVTLAKSNELTLECITATIHAHPTLSEALHEAALAVDNRAIHIARKKQK